MDLAEVVPRGTNEYRFLQAQSDYFGFYNMYIITKVLDTVVIMYRLLTQ